MNIGTDIRINANNHNSIESGRYADARFADPVNHKYPIDSPAHVRVAWNYIHQKENAAQYNTADFHKIKERIRQAAQTFHIEIEEI